MIRFGSVMLENEISDQELSAAIADVFRVQRVSVWSEMADVDRSADVFVQRLDRPGEFSVGTYILINSPAGDVDSPAADKETLLKELAARLNRLVLTDSFGTEFEDELFLVTPGGESAVLTADESELAQGRLTFIPESKRQLAEMKRRVATVAA